LETGIEVRYAISEANQPVTASLSDRTTIRFVIIQPMVVRALNIAGSISAKAGGKMKVAGRSVWFGMVAEATAGDSLG
jgi:hypothetical protein